ncbi:hypothetical protein FJ977_07575 [Mesorhizobium sp. B2-1-3A]|nr:hypothetical protein [Mesorhizobium sp. B2-1-3A]TPM99270.1 hypothetical protein FJ977_07575 [Mesorhizobium sp. B2-1-3A]
MTGDVSDRNKLLRFPPTLGDSHYPGTTEGGRAVDLPYPIEVAKAADMLHHPVRWKDSILRKYIPSGDSPPLHAWS